MKIIKHGKKPEPKILRFECQKCGCVFEAEDVECAVLGHMVSLGGAETVAYNVECPECHERVTAYA